MESLSGARLQPRPPLARALHPLFFSRHAPDGEVCGAQDEIKEVAGFCPLKDLIKALADDVPGVAEYVRRRLARYKADEMFKAAEASADDDEEVDDEVKAMSAMLLADSAPPSSVGPAAEVPPHSRILEQPRADTFQKSFDAQVQEAERSLLRCVAPAPRTPC